MTGGLRELKKRRTKAAIQQEAVRLITDQGFDATTVEQIAAAAEI
jgi:AcrR family transcriptional regulator